MLVVLNFVRTLGIVNARWGSTGRSFLLCLRFLWTRLTSTRLVWIFRVGIVFVRDDNDVLNYFILYNWWWNEIQLINKITNSSRSKSTSGSAPCATNSPKKHSKSLTMASPSTTKTIKFINSTSTTSSIKPPPNKKYSNHLASRSFKTSSKATMAPSLYMAKLEQAKPILWEPWEQLRGRTRVLFPYPWTTFCLLWTAPRTRTNGVSAYPLCKSICRISTIFSILQTENSR